MAWIDEQSGRRTVWHWNPVREEGVVMNVVDDWIRSHFTYRSETKTDIDLGVTNSPQLTLSTQYSILAEKNKDNA
jgi:hypothetical protein